MAELDFKHHVSEIPRGEALPAPLQRTVRAEISNIPNYQEAANRYAENTNWMSALGSSVATKASNAIAEKLGSELGKNPQGDIGTPFTEFDKQLANSYSVQAQSTLGLQAQKLISQSNLELAASPRIDPDMIAKSQQSVMQGLEKIFSLTPSSVRPHMETQYGALMIQQNEYLVERMLREQKLDRKNNLDFSSQIYAENAHSLAISGTDSDKNGESKAALAAVKAATDAANSALANHDITPLQAKIIIDTARQAHLSGKYTRLALQAEKENRLPEFLKSIADNPPSDISDKDHLAVINNVSQYMNQQAALRSQDQQLKLAQFAVKLAEDPNAISGSEFAELQEALNPIQAQRAKLDLIQALSARRKDNEQSDLLMAEWGNSSVHARAGEKAQNVTFDRLVQHVAKSSNGAVSLDNAEVQVAASAGSPIPVFTKSLQYKLSSGNPQLMESAAQQIHSLYQMGAGHALSGLSEKDKAMFGAIETLRSSLDPTEAMREAVNKIYNQDPVMYKANQQKWSDYISRSTRGISTSDFALSKFGYSKKQFINPSVAQVYGVDMLEKYGTYYQLLGGDEVAAQRVTKRYIDENYGMTGVNGGKYATLHPLEKVLGYNTSNVVPVIQQDVSNQLNKNFLTIKEAYKRGETNEYWEVIPLTDKKHGIFSTTYDPIKVRRYTKENNGIKSEDFDVVLQGNAFDNWDIAIRSESGLRPLYQVAPYLGIINYIPNKKEIDAEFLRRHS